MSTIKFPEYDVTIDPADLSLAEMKAAHASELLVTAAVRIEGQMMNVIPRTEEDALALAALWEDLKTDLAPEGSMHSIAQGLVRWIKAAAAQPHIMQAAE